MTKQSAKKKEHPHQPPLPETNKRPRYQLPCADDISLMHLQYENETVLSTQSRLQRIPLFDVSSSQLNTRDTLHLKDQSDNLNPQYGCCTKSQGKSSLPSTSKKSKLQMQIKGVSLKSDGRTFPVPVTMQDANITCLPTCTITQTLKQKSKIPSCSPIILTEDYMKSM